MHNVARDIAPLPFSYIRNAKLRITGAKILNVDNKDPTSCFGRVMCGKAKLKISKVFEQIA